MAIGNILGSQIFNILLIIGTSAVLTQINYSKSYDSNIILLIIGSIVLGMFPFVGKKNQMSRANGITFVLTYIAYILGIVLYAWIDVDIKLTNCYKILNSLEKIKSFLYNINIKIK